MAISLCTNHLAIIISYYYVFSLGFVNMGSLLEHLVLTNCPALLFVHCYCCFCTLWANE